MCMMLALLAGAALAAYGFFVWRHEKQSRKESNTTMRRARRAF
jgi:Flp pilus assembly protein TadB